MNGERNAVGAAVRSVLGSVVDQRRQEETDGDAELVGTDDETTDPFWQSLGLVHWDLGRDETNTKTSKETSSDEHGLRRGSDLESDTEVKWESGADDDTPFATNLVGEITTSESTEESTDGENGDDQRDLVGIWISKLILPIWHLLDTRDGTSVVSIQDTSKCSKGANHDGRPRRTWLIIRLLDTKSHLDR